MQTKQLDITNFKDVLVGGASEIKLNIQAINDLNVFPVPDGDTGTNMCKTIESGIMKIGSAEGVTFSEAAHDFARGSLLGARGNSGVILSQFFAGVCEVLEKKEYATASDLSEAYLCGVQRAYSAVTKPVEGTILTVFRESAEYAKSKVTAASTIVDFLAFLIEEGERSLLRTKEILPALIEADVVDSGAAGYLSITKGMYKALSGEEIKYEPIEKQKETSEVNYDLFTSESVLEFGYCTECLVRLQRCKGEPENFDEAAFAEELTSLGCESIVALRDTDILKVHAHTVRPSDVLILCQRYGEFLNVKIENMSLQHSERTKENVKKKKRPHKHYGVVTVSTGEGMTALFESLGADVVINGGQTGNPSTEQFVGAFESLDVDEIIVLPNNSNILLTANQASELYSGAHVTVIPTKTIPEGYAALSVFNSSIPEIEEQLDDIIFAKDSVVSGEVTRAIRDCNMNDVEVKEGEYIGILDGEIVNSSSDLLCAVEEMINKTEDLDEKEVITLFVGKDVSDEERVKVTEMIEEKFDELSLDVHIGKQEIYNFLIAIE